MVVVNYFKDELGVIQSPAPECGLVTVLIAVRKCLTKTRKEGCVWVHSLRVQSIKLAVNSNHHSVLC